jgi:hypothetical protein
VISVTTTATTTVTNYVSTDLAPLLAALLGAAIGGALGWGGVLLSNRLQRGERRRERLSEAIYRPLLGQIGQIREQIENGQMPDLSGLLRTRQDGMYYVIKEGLGQMTDSISNGTKIYNDVYKAASVVGQTIVREEIERFLQDRQEDLKKYQSGGYELNYRAFFRHQHLGNVKLQDCLIMDMTPADVLLKMGSIAQDSEIDSNISGYSVDRQVADEISRAALERAREHPYFIAEKQIKKNLLGRLQKTIEMLEEEI